MKCPVDGSTLALSERNGIEIDYCPDCRGVWLDRGELDKIIDRADARGGYSQPSRYDEHNSGHGDYGKRRRGGWLGELFD